MVAAILSVAALILSKPVTLPLVLGLFLIVLAWPLQQTLERRIPRPLALTATALVVLAAISVVAGAFVWSTVRVVERAPEIERQLGELRDRVAGWATARGMLPRAAELEAPADASAAVRGALGAVYSALVTIGLAFAFLVLGLLEVRDFERKIATRLRRDLGSELLETAAQIARQVRRYLIALTITSAISGIATGLYALALGLELAPLWGFATFVLNYMPTVGPAVAVVPPTLYALLQFDTVARPLAILAGVGLIQFTVGNFVDPKVEGRVLSLSPVMVLFGILFWGWVWGPFGALLAVPITAGLTIVAGHARGLRWFAALAAGEHADAPGGAAPAPAPGEGSAPPGRG